jgi:acyl-CoA thioesterase-1
MRALLSAVSGKAHAVVMLELPLPPFSSRYGAAQRRLAAEFNVTLLPKHRFAEVFEGTGSTTDSIHLSPAGQQKMANTIWKFVAPLLEPSTRRVPADTGIKPPTLFAALWPGG